MLITCCMQFFKKGIQKKILFICGREIIEDDKLESCSNSNKIDSCNNSNKVINNINKKYIFNIDENKLLILFIIFIVFLLINIIYNKKI